MSYMYSFYFRFYTFDCNNKMALQLNYEKNVCFSIFYIFLYYFDGSHQLNERLTIGIIRINWECVLKLRGETKKFPPLV